MLTETRSVQSVKPPPGCPAVCPAVLRKIEHLGWTEASATLPICATSSECRLESNPFLDKERSICLNVDAFEEKERLASMHSELQADGVQAAETALVQNPGVPGGIQATSISRIVATPVMAKDGRIIGRFFEDSDARYCMLGDIRPPISGLPGASKPPRCSISSRAP